MRVFYPCFLSKIGNFYELAIVNDEDILKSSSKRRKFEREE